MRAMITWPLEMRPRIRKTHHSITRLQSDMEHRSLFKRASISLTRTATQSRGTQFHDMFEPCDTIGRGRTNIVVRYRYLKCPFEEVAAKVCYCPKLSDEGTNQPEVEANILKKLSHQNIVRCQGIYYENPHCYLVMDLLAGGNIIEYISAKHRYKEQDARRYIGEILSAVAYMHSKKILHRALDPENIMMSTTQEDAIAKIIDFGCAVVTSGRRRTVATKVNPGLYSAPEIFERKEYVRASDVWSCGLILYELLIGSVPVTVDKVEGEKEEDQESRLRQAMLNAGPVDLWSTEWQESGVTYQAKRFLRTILVRDPESRLTVTGALQSQHISRRGAYGTFLHETHLKLKRSDEASR